MFARIHPLSWSADDEDDDEGDDDDDNQKPGPGRPEPPDDDDVIAQSIRSYRLELEGAKFWELSEKGSIFLKGSGSFRLSGSDEGDDREQAWELFTGYTLDVWGRDRSLRYGDFRFELRGGITGEVLEEFREETFMIQGDLVFRNRWGQVRLGIRYENRDVNRRAQSQRPGGRP